MGKHTDSRIYIRVSQEDAEYESLKSEGYFRAKQTRGYWVCGNNQDRSNARSIGFSGEWLTISQLAQKHPDWLDKDEELSDFVEEAVYLVNEQ